MSASRDHSRSRLSPRSLSRPRVGSRNNSAASLRYTPENLILPDGQIDEETVQHLQDFVHPHHHEAEETLVEGDPEQLSFQTLAEERSKLPWYKRPSPYWFLSVVALSAFAMSTTIAPRIEIYTHLACQAHKPNYTVGRGTEESGLYALYGSAAALSADADERERLCASDPDVQAAVASLIMVYTTAMGVLGCLTTGWWTSLSDRLGRIRILGYAIFGVLFADSNFILVSKFSQYLPGKYWWFILGGLADGLFGSQSTLNATIHAYIADTVEPHSRSRMYSLYYGLLFTGFALGPTIGGLIVRFTETPLSVFYMSAGFHVFFALLLWFIVPESLTPAQTKESQRLYDQSVEKAKREAIDAPTLARLKRMFGFLSPLTVFWSTAKPANGNPLKARRGDWSLLLLALSSAFALTVMGSYQYKFQYTSAVFGWTSEQIGYWLTIVGFVRAAYLTLILPTIIKLFKPVPPAIQLPTGPSEPLQPESTSSSSPSASSSSVSSIKPQSAPTTNSSIQFDLNLARVSVVIEFLAFGAIPFTSSPLVFTALSVLSSFGAGHPPAAQSVALGLYAESGGTESGKMLGALSVMQIVASQVVGPALFGMTYVKTVATMPTMIFFVSAAAVGISLFLLFCIRLPKTTYDIEEPAAASAHQQDETLVDADVPIIVVDAPSPKVSSSRA